MDHFANFRRHEDPRGPSMYTWTNEIPLKATPSNWQGLLNFSKGFYERVMNDPKAKDPEGVNRAVSQGGTCLAATLCYPFQGGCHLFQCTIPRGRFRDNMMDDGKAKAPGWWQANSLPKGNGEPGRDGPDRLHIHAEDGAEYLLFSFNARHGKPLPPQHGRLRIIVYGHINCKTGPPVPAKQNLCYPGSEKKPCCEAVAQRLRIAFVPKGKTVEKQDEEDRLQVMQQKEQQPPSSSGYSDPGWTASQFDAATKRPPSSSSGSEFSNPGWTAEDFDKATQGAPASGASGTKSAPSRRQGDKAMDQLTKSMASLSTGGKTVAPPRAPGQPSRGPAPPPANSAGGRPSQPAPKETLKKRPGEKSG